MILMEAVPSQVIRVIGRSGPKGVNVVKCKVIDGPDKGKILTRNVMGPVRVGDTLMLLETEMESAARVG